MEKIYYYNAIKNILSIKTNVRDFKFSYGLSMPECDKKEYDEALIKMDVDIVTGNLTPSAEEKKEMGKFHYFSGKPGLNKMYYERSFLFNKKMQYVVSDINTNHIKIKANRTYYKFVTHRFMNIHSIGYMLTDIANLRFLHNGLAPLHCSGISKDGISHIIFAPPNTGKTLTAMTICMEDKSYSYVAEDLALTDGERAFSVPWTSTFRYYDSIDSSWWSRTLNNLTEKISILELFSFGKVEKVTKYVSSVEDESKIKGLYILDRGPEEVRDISPEDAFRRINTLDRYEFNYMRAPIVIAYEYFNPDTDIEAAYANERTLLKKMIDKAEFVKVISTSNALNYAGVIKGIMES